MTRHTLKKSLLALGGVFFSSLSAHAQIESGLLNYWQLDGTANDTAVYIPGASGTSTDNGTINGGVTFADAATEGLGAGFGQAASFPGAGGDNITVPDPTGATDDIDRSGADLSISVWVKASQWNTGWQAIVAHGEGADYRIARRASDNPVLFAYAGGTGDIATVTSYGTAPAGDGLWHHIVATTQNGGVTQLYVNGVLEATSAGVPAIAASGGNNNVLCIGCNPDNGREFNGLMDDVAMWDRVLTGAEVTAIHDAGRLGNALSSLLPAPADDDGDGLPNAWEILYGLDPDDNGDADPANGALGDFDMDNVDNITEFNNSTLPNDSDSDDDGLTDDIESGTGIFVSASDAGTDPLSGDTDGDGLTDNVETNTGAFVSSGDTGTNPVNADTDADGVDDGFELLKGTSPFDDQDFPGPAPTMTWDASFDLDGDNLWPTVEVPEIAGIAWNFGAPKMTVTGASNFAAVTAWYNSPSATMESFNDAPLSAAPFSQGTNQPVSFELVFRPIDLVGDHLLFETGGNGDGLGIVINGDTLFFRAQDANNDTQRVILSHTFTAGDEANFHHIVGTLQNGITGTNEGVLYVNGVEVDRIGATGTLNDWAGGDNSGLGVLTGSTPTGQNGFAPFTGDIAILRYYSGKVLTAAEVQATYDQLSANPDSDSDGLRDSWERSNFLDLSEIATGDPDADGLDNLGEFNAGTDPNAGDSDGDGINDGDEVNGSANPYKDGVLGALPGDPTLPTNADSDGDGLDDSIETSDANGFVTDPNNQDTDGDRVRDDIEIEEGFDPTDANSKPAIPVITLLGGLIGGDLTDPENDGVESETIPAGVDTPQTAGIGFNWVGITASAEEYFQGFGAATEGSFDMFDNKIGGGEAKLCCGGAPLFATVEFETPVSLTHFTLTSSNDTPARDPLDFQIQGSNDGISFETIYARADDTSIWGTTRNLTARIDLPFPSDAYKFIRYDVTRTGGVNHALSEIEYFGVAGSLAPPEVTSIDYNTETNQVTLTWNSRDNKTYSVFTSTDLFDFSSDINDSVPSGGEFTTFTFTLLEPFDARRFFRVMENE